MIRRRSRRQSVPGSSRQRCGMSPNFWRSSGLPPHCEPVPLRVTYQDSCHLAHGQKIREAPRKLIRAVPGVELVEMPLADQCCGSAGVYNVTETEASLELLAKKMEYVKQTQTRRRSSPRIPAASCSFARALRFTARARKCCTWSNFSTAQFPQTRAEGHSREKRSKADQRELFPKSETPGLTFWKVSGGLGSYFSPTR